MEWGVVMVKTIKHILLASGFFFVLAWANISSAVIIQLYPDSVAYTGSGPTGYGYGDISITGSFNLTRVASPVDGWDRLIFENIDVVASDPGFLTPALEFPLPDSVLYNGSVFDYSTVCIAIPGVICPADEVSGDFDGTTFFMQRLYTSGIDNDYEYQIWMRGTVVPLPASVWLFSVGLIGFSLLKRKTSV